MTLLIIVMSMYDRYPRYSFRVKDFIHEWYEIQSSLIIASTFVELQNLILLLLPIQNLSAAFQSLSNLGNFSFIIQK